MFKSRKSVIIKKNIRGSNLSLNSSLRSSNDKKTKMFRQRNSEKINSAATILNTTEHGAWDTKGNNLVYETELIRDDEYQKALEIINLG